MPHLLFYMVGWGGMAGNFGISEKYAFTHFELPYFLLKNRKGISIKIVKINICNEQKCYVTHGFNPITSKLTVK